MELAVHIDHLDGEGVVALLDAAVFVAVLRFRDYRCGAGKAAAPPASSTAAGRGLVRIGDLCVELLYGHFPGCGKVGANGFSDAVDHVAGKTAAFTFEDQFAGRRVTRDSLTADGNGRAAAAAKASDIGNDLPRLIGRELRKCRHLGASNAAPDGDEDLAIGIAVSEIAADEGGTAIAPPVGSVARHARGVIQIAASGDCLRVSCDRIALSFGAVALSEATACR